MTSRDMKIAEAVRDEIIGQIAGLRVDCCPSKRVSDFLMVNLDALIDAIEAAERQAQPAELTDAEITKIADVGNLWDRHITFARAVIAADRAKRGG